MVNKDAYLLGDFNINDDSDIPTSQFLGSVYSNSFFPHINIPTSHTPRFKTFIDNIFHININESAISGSLATDTSDHLAQFLITHVLSSDFEKYTHM